MHNCIKTYNNKKIFSTGTVPLSCSMFMLCVLVSVLLLGEGCVGLFGGGGGGGRAGVASDVLMLAVCVVCWWSDKGCSLVYLYWLHEWCLGVWRCWRWSLVSPLVTACVGCMCEGCG